MKNFFKPTKITRVSFIGIALYFVLGFLYAVANVNTPRNVDHIELTLLDQIVVTPIVVLIVLPAVYLSELIGVPAAFYPNFLLMAVLVAYVLACLIAWIWYKIYPANHLTPNT